MPEVNRERTKTLLKVNAYAELKEQIMTGQLRVGTMLSVRKLAREMGVSNSPVRWAIERLETEGFIDISPQQGFVVRPLSIPEVADHYESREIVESAVVRKIAGRLSETDVEQLRDNLDWQEKTLNEGRVREFIKADREFHLLLCGFLGNEDLRGFMVQLGDRIFRVIMQVEERNPSRLEGSYKEHRQIFEAVVQGEGERAAQLVKEHLEKGRQVVLPSFRLLPTRRR
jgi:DNA-binding GntR family transcriptional regulator